MNKANEVLVKIKLPRIPGQKDDGVYVSVNDRSWMIKRGEEVTVPVCVAEVIEQSERLCDEAAAYTAGIEVR